MFKRIVMPLLLSALVSATALAAGKPFNADEFAGLQQAGKPVLIHVHADWCPTCKAQDPIVSGLLKDPRFKAITGMEVDFDSRKDLLKTWKVSSQSTLLLFTGGKELTRSVGETRPAAIEAMLQKAK